MPRTGASDGHRGGPADPVTRPRRHRIPALRTVAQPIRRRTVEPCAADALLEICMVGQQAPASLVNVVCEGPHLAGNDALLLLIGR
jgi:hypothetical protein